jgi:hypothetical protein
MTQDEIIEMARQAGMYQDLNVSWNQSIQNFAKLVAAKEREACAGLCEELAELSRISATDSMWEWGECAAAIRARGNV